MIVKREQMLPDWSIKSHFDWSAIFDLLETEKYECVAASLQEAQRLSEQSGDLIWAEILGAARQICLACHQYQTQIVWHQRASTDIRRREHELEQVLYNILDLVQGQPIKDIPCPDPSDYSTNNNGWWQRILHLFGQAASSSSGADPQRLPESALPQSMFSVEERPHLSLPPHLQKSLSSLKMSSHGSNPSVAQAESFFIVHCLGPFQIYQEGQLIDNWSSRKAQQLFKYLITHNLPPVSKDTLMDVFWPEAEPEAARRNLHQAIYALRQTLKPKDGDLQVIQFEHDCYRLNPELSIWLDFEKFEQHAQAGQRHKQAGILDQAMLEFSLAESLYQGDFLSDDLYEEWTQARRHHLQQIYLSAAHQLAEHYLAEQEYAMAITLCHRILAIDICQEEAHQNLMCCYLAQGQRHLAIRQYQLCLQALKADLDLPPSLETQTLYQKIAEG